MAGRGASRLGVLLLGVTVLGLTPGLAVAQSEARRSYDVFDDELPSGDAEDGAAVGATSSPDPAPPPSAAEPPPAAPAPPAVPKLLVLVQSEDPALAGQALRVGRAATRVLARAQGMTAASFDGLVDAKIDEERAADLTEGLAAVQRGQVAFEELDLESAGAELDLGITLLVSMVEDLNAAQRRTLDQALFTLATTTLFEGRGPLADSIFVALALLSPDYTPKGAGYPSNVLARFGEIRAGLAEREIGEMDVRSNPPGAAVWVDGVFRGATPLSIPDLADGQHAVLLARLGHRAHGVLSPVTAGRSARVEIDLEPTAAASLAATLSPALATDAEAALALGRKLGVDRLATLVLRDGAAGLWVEGLWIDVAEGRPRAQLSRTRSAEDPEVAGTLIAGAVAEAETRPAAIVTAEPEPSAPWVPPAVLGEWWFWAIVGGVAVAAGTTVAVVAASDGGGGPPSSGFILGF